jgi:hypothetical protein
MLDDLRLSLMAFPQSWNAATNTLAVNLIVLPVGDPTGPIGTVPVFGGTALKLVAHLQSGDALPTSGATAAVSVPFIATPPVPALPLLKSMTARLPAGTTVTTGTITKLQAPPANVRVKKALPPSYTQAFPFTRPSDPNLFIVGDGYCCEVEGQASPIIPKDPPAPLPPPPPKTIAWGQILSYILRQPLLARACGLLYSTTVTIPPAVAAGTSWIYFSIDTSNASNPFAAEVAANADFVRSYAARVPALGKDRRLFAATLFPLVPTTNAALSTPDQEAQTYDDGFAQIVHSYQPPTFDAATGTTDGMKPGAEAGIQIAWDDEQVTTWLDRQIGLLRDRANNTAANPESPLGVVGYRIDVSPSGANTWSTLCGVSGSLPFSAGTSNGTGSTVLPAGAELVVTPSPVRALPSGPGPSAEPTWLPLYFAAWRGSSLVADDLTYGLLNPPDKAAPSGQPIGNSYNTKLPSSALRPADLPAAPRYGQSYDFRVRLVDLSGGGATVSDQPLHPGLAPVATAPFRRHIPPKALLVTATPAPPALPAKPAPVSALTSLAVQRPRIGYPEALFAGVPASTFQGASLTALVNAAFASGRSAGVADPDVDRFTVTVEAAIPDHDSGPAGSLPGDLDGKWRIVYSITETFPVGTDPTVTLALSYTDVPDIAAMTPPADNASTLPIPTARDIRIRVTPQLAARSNYYGEAVPPAGPTSDYIVRREAAAEASLFPFVPEQQVLAAYLQPGGDLPSLLAQGFGLNANGLTLSGPDGVRTVFAVSGALRASLAPDRSTVTLATSNELLDHWIVAIVLDIARDWTWDGFSAPALTLSRDGTTVATLIYPAVVSQTALGSVSVPADRTRSRIILLDAIVAHPAPGAFPDVLNPHYSVTATFPTAAPLTRTYTTLKLPITTPPAQAPKIVATGIAESAFVAAADYSSTQLRDRYLWIEFAAAIADTSDDVYFGRVLAYGPDPLLAGGLLPPHTAPNTAPEPPLPIDPEPIRVIFAGEDSDENGLDAMTPLIPAVTGGSGTDGVHFLLPLPPGLTPEALELFGFWTYEFRVGHAKKWSTARGRFGRALRVSGVQHPPPPLTCTIWRNDTGITVTAPYATTLLNGVVATRLASGDPQTALWFMLYTQVLQTDGAAHRNILIGRQLGKLMTVTIPGGPTVLLPNREPRGTATFVQTDIATMLSQLGLPATSPISLLAVEILPGRPHIVDRGTVVAAESIIINDPLGSQLGQRRILRTSPLTAAPSIC